MSEATPTTLSQPEVRQLHQRFQRIALVSKANQLTKFPIGELDQAVKVLMQQEAQQLHRQLRRATFTSSLSYVDRLTLPDPRSISPDVTDKQAAYLAFRQAVLTSSANVLREQQAAALRQKVTILNVEIDNLSMQEFLSQLKQGVVFTPNVDHLMKLQHDETFVNAYQQADYRVCDSQILLYAAKFLGDPIRAKISGSDLFPQFCDYHAQNEQIRIFLLGGATGIPEKAQARINQRSGRNIIIQAHSPSFGFENNAEECDRIIQLINQSGANVLVVGVGAPKQEIWITKYRSRLPQIDIFLAVGAAIDFEAGNKPRSPAWMSRFGVEWLHRLASEPGRLWKRYLLEDMPFFGLLLKQKLAQLSSR